LVRVCPRFYGERAQLLREVGDCVFRDVAPRCDLAVAALGRDEWVDGVWTKIFRRLLQYDSYINQLVSQFLCDSEFVGGSVNNFYVHRESVYDESFTATPAMIQSISFDGAQCHFGLPAVSQVSASSLPSSGGPSRQTQSVEASADHCAEPQACDGNCDSHSAKAAVQSGDVGCGSSKWSWPGFRWRPSWCGM
jgi:hypothetical protein